MKSTYLLALAAVAIAASTGFSQMPVSISDPSFETPSVDPYYTIVTGAGTSTYLAPWTVASGGDVVNLVYGPHETPFNAHNFDGYQFLEDVATGASGGGTVSQLLTTSFRESLN